MASFKVMRSSSNSRNSDLSRRISTTSSSSIRPQQFIREDFNADQTTINGGYGGKNDEYNIPTGMTVEGIIHDAFTSDPPVAESTLLDASMNLMDASTPMEIAVTDADRNTDPANGGDGGGEATTETRVKSVDEVWREIVTGESKGMKEETQEDIMTLEDFLAKAAVEDAAAGRGGDSDDIEVKIPSERLSCGGGVYAYDQQTHNPFQMIDKVEGSIVAFGNGLDVYDGGGTRGKRARVMVEPLDKAAAQRQRRMIKNRESAARSRERKQAYQVELETLAAKLEKENEMLSREIEERRKERYQKLMEFVIPVVEKAQAPRLLRRIRSLEW